MLKGIIESKLLWDYAVKYISEVRSHTACPMCKFYQHMSYEIVPVDTPNIIEWLQYDFYQLVWFYSPAVFLVEKQLLGRWFGVAQSSRTDTICSILVTYTWNASTL